ncbi:MAG: hypothetical protein ABIY50_13830 [Ignavibacteria bacterium]
MNKFKTILLLFTVLMNSNLIAQQNDKTLDFWIGKWDAYWNDSLKGTNQINVTMNGYIVEENFSTNDGTFTGKSWSAFDSVTNLWKQTWVDNSGAYMTFAGGGEGNKVILNMIEARKNKSNKNYYMRMVFSDINDDQFEWNWQSSVDKISWKPAWTIHYKRAESKE